MSIPENMDIERVTFLLTQLHPFSQYGEKRAYNELSQFRIEDLFETFQKILRTEPKLKKMVVRAAFRVNTDRALPLVLPLLDDPNSDIRVHVCGLLSQYGNERAIASLIYRLSDINSDVRFTAAYALGQIGDSSAIPALEEVQKNDKGTDYEGRPISDMALEAIGMIQSRFD